MPRSKTIGDDASGVSSPDMPSETGPDPEGTTRFAAMLGRLIGQHLAGRGAESAGFDPPSRPQRPEESATS